MRDGWLQSVEAVIQRQQRVAAECYNHGLFCLSQDRRAQLLRPGLQILDRRLFAPLRHRLGIDAELPAQRRER